MTRDMIVGLLGLFLGGGYTAMALMLPVSAVQDGVGPRLFPCIVGGVAFLAGLVLVLRERACPREERKVFSFEFREDRKVYVKILLTVAGGIAYGMLLDPLGYVLATMGFMLFLTFMVSSRAVQNLAISLLFPLVTYVVFSNLLSLSLPRGILGELLPYF
jgi:putative tricarboxylic transport membrane protein